MKPLFIHLLALVILFLAGPAARAVELDVFAAASLTDALQEVTVAYEKASGDTINLNLGASSTLARQIQEGAPADLFLSADEEKMDALERRGLVLQGTRRSVLSNTLVIVTPADSTPKIASPRDLAGSRVRSLALADPRLVPAGIYARAWLQKLGLWSTVAGRVIPTENVRAALAAVESGNVDAGIVFKTDARISKKVKIAYDVLPAQGPRISCPFAIMAGTKRPGAARRFLVWLESEPALAVFRRYGFRVLESGK